MSSLKLKDLEQCYSSAEIKDRRYYPKFGCQPGCDPTSHALHSYARDTVHLRNTNESRTWPTSKSNVALTVFLGTGQIGSPLTVDEETFAEICRKAKISQPFLAKIRAKRPFLEYSIEYSNVSNDEPVALELAISTYETDSFLFLVRYNLLAKTLKGLAAFKAKDTLTIQPLTFERILSWLDAQKESIEEHPLLLMPILWELIQRRGHNPVRWRVALYSEESRLGITRRKEFLANEGYPPISYDYELLNAELASLSKELADATMSAATIRYLALEYDKITDLCFTQKAMKNHWQQEIGGVVRRADLYLFHLENSQTILQGLNTVLHNRSTHHETQATKSIAIIGLVFLPCMLIAAIFSAGLFDLESTRDSPVSSPSQHHRSVLSAWRIFLVTCFGSIFVTLVLWTVWCRYGQKWVDKWVKSSLESRMSGPTQVPEEHELRKRRRIASEGASGCLISPEDTMKYSMQGGSSGSDGYCEHSRYQAE